MNIPYTIPDSDPGLRKLDLTMPGLLFYNGEEEILRFPLSGARLRIGRHPSNDLTLRGAEVSRFHAILESRGSPPAFWIIDQSRNGTFLNGGRIKASPLKENDTLCIGGWRILFIHEVSWSGDETAAEKKSKLVPSFCGMVGPGEPMQRVYSMVERVAPTMATVLISGETGTGKELIARALHDLSPRQRKNFVPLNCGAISPQLIESELFGHERGAFTGAIQRHLGAFEQARGGTLFLDEIGELPFELQPKLLRVLEEGRFRRVGGQEEIDADVRIVAATHRDLRGMVREGRFRDDLFFRLYAVPIHLPPLRERRQDIPMLVEHFCASLQKGGRSRDFSTAAIARLTESPWRGNIRELKNVISRSLLFSKGERVEAEEILFLEGQPAMSDRSLESAEKNAILSALKESGWNRRKAANLLGIAKSTLFHKIKEFEIKQ